MIDHILVTSTIKKYIANSFVYHGYDEYCGKYNSDHYPVVIDFLFWKIRNRRFLLKFSFRFYINSAIQMILLIKKIIWFWQYCNKC